MIYLQMILSIIYFFISHKINNRIIKNITYIVLGIFCAQLLLNILDLYDYHKISLYVFALYNLSLLSFVIGVLLMKKRAISCHYQVSESVFSNIKFLIIIQSIICFISFYYYQKYSFVLQNVSENAREILYVQGTLFKRYYEQFIYIYIINNTRFISVALFFFVLFKNNKKKKEILLMFLALINFTLLFMIGQGRLDFMSLVIFPLVYAIVVQHNNYSNINKRVRMYIFLLIPICFLFILVTTALRLRIYSYNDFILSDAFDIFLAHNYLYFSFPINAFEYAINNFYSNSIFYGAATFGGIIDIFLIPVKFISKDIKGINDIMGSVMSPFYSIYGHSWNALYTSIINHYLDFGILGIIFFSIIWGYIIARLTMNAINKPNFINIILLQYIVYSYILGIFSSKTQSFEFWFFLIILYIFKLLTKKKYLLKL